ncbi:hypothetical protein D3C85_581820 [compost metagenome]
MAAIITEIIPIQGFEIVLNKIGVVLFEELSNQKTIQVINGDFDVFIERQESYDKSEDVVINVSLDNDNFSGKTQKDSQGLTTFFIDIYSKGFLAMKIGSNTFFRDKRSIYAGLIRYILASTKYNKLGFEPGFIGGAYVDNIAYQSTPENEDGSFVKFARINYSVRIQENQKNWSGIPFMGNDSEIKLSETQLGYKLTFNN